MKTFALVTMCLLLLGGCASHGKGTSMATEELAPIDLSNPEDVNRVLQAASDPKKWNKLITGDEGAGIMDLLVPNSPDADRHRRSEELRLHVLKSMIENAMSQLQRPSVQEVEDRYPELLKPARSQMTPDPLQEYSSSNLDAVIGANHPAIGPPPNSATPDSGQGGLAGSGFLGGYTPNAYGPGLNMDATGRPFMWQPQWGGTGFPDPTLQVKPDAYGPGVGMDQYGRPVRPACPPGWAGPC